MNKALQDRISEAMGQIEERLTDIESGLDALLVIENEYFGDGTASTYEESKIMADVLRFGRTGNALLFTGKAMREALDVLRDNADLLYKWAREMAEKLEEAAAEGTALDAVTALQRAGRLEE